MRTVLRYYDWHWHEVPSAEGAAWGEEWTYAGDGSIVGRRRVALAKKPTGPTISTDPRAGAIMREELGLHHRHTPMSGPHHH